MDNQVDNKMVKLNDIHYGKSKTTPKKIVVGLVIILFCLHCFAPILKPMLGQ